MMAMLTYAYTSCIYRYQNFQPVIYLNFNILEGKNVNAQSIQDHHITFSIDETFNIFWEKSGTNNKFQKVQSFS